jgi:hypothetical protein
MPEVFFVSMVLLCVLELGERLLDGELSLAVGLTSVSVSHLSVPVKLSLVPMLELAKLAILAGVAVDVHRFVLLNESNFLLTPLRRSYGWRYLLWLVAITFCEGLVALPVLLSRWWIVFMIPAMIVISTRISIIFPAVAIEASGSGWKTRLEYSWRVTKGRVLSLLAAWLLAIIPFSLILALATIASVIFKDARVNVVGSALSDLLTAAVVASVLSCSYRALRAADNAPAAP